ncbi:MAG: DNA polymerase IV [Candidatus Acetothermia bacterium]|jgi:DNA polymerase-4|nr:DNA polymerase IV [Candidatus Acetothermia bacterium]MDH7505608.1 DNA polymerase IV [Candidatus Acetothermia bacterium]
MSTGLQAEEERGRVIFLLDMDSYFASVEQQANPFLRGRPIIVSGRADIQTVVAAASREAKRWGIRSGMSTFEARRLCPRVEFLPGDPAKYLSITTRFLEILRRYTDLVEVFSIDEAFMDVTSIHRRYGGPIALAERIKGEIRRACGPCITCSIGIARNKLLAKLAAEMHKPDGLTWIKDEQIPEVLEKVSLTDVCGIGERIARRLNSMGIYRLSELGGCDEEWLVKEFGAYGKALKLIGQGRDPSPGVIPYYHQEEEKSVGHSLTLPYEWRTFERAKIVLYRLCEQVARRLRKGGHAGRTVSLWLVSQDYEGVHKQYTLDVPTDDGELIFKTCLKISEMVEIPKTVRAVGVSVSNLERAEALPQPLFAQGQRKERLLRVVDEINDEYGEMTLFQAVLLATKRMEPHVGKFGRTRELALG